MLYNTPHIFCVTLVYLPYFSDHLRPLIFVAYFVAYFFTYLLFWFYFNFAIGLGYLEVGQEKDVN